MNKRKWVGCCILVQLSGCCTLHKSMGAASLHKSMDAASLCCQWVMCPCTKSMLHPCTCPWVLHPRCTDEKTRPLVWNVAEPIQTASVIAILLTSKSAALFLACDAAPIDLHRHSTHDASGVSAACSPTERVFAHADVARRPTRREQRGDAQRNLIQDRSSVRGHARAWIQGLGLRWVQFQAPGPAHWKFTPALHCRIPCFHMRIQGPPYLVRPSTDSKGIVVRQFSPLDASLFLMSPMFHKHARTNTKDSNLSLRNPVWANSTLDASRVALLR